ncbi:putative translation initiation factor SUI1 [Necator americanus]|uniref:Mannosyltransferase n=1 Tax=Necator americanus TaxID=51031 RepID=W2T0H1_NECAM|nr:putative translation initiation factor SUI1 [Necator americanus]ETN75500.1 putative translation initiation factor SUI1 [Necator americanus]
MASITNLNKPKDAFEQLEDEHGARQGFCHIRIQQRTGRKTITTVQGVGTEYDLKRIVRFLKKMRCYQLWLLLFAFRLLGVLVIQSWFVPDEVYQSSEVAHRAVFGTGHLTWEWTHALRSPLHPALIAVVYKCIQWLGLDSQVVIPNVPRIFHAFLFTFGDISYYMLCRRLLPTNDAAFYSMITYLSSWFIFYCAPRTLSNSLETVLTLIALVWYPFVRRHMSSRVWPYILIGTLAIVIRPTAALIWIIFGVSHLIRHPKPVNLLFFTVLPATLPVLFVSTLVDSLCYARPTSTLWNFLSFNVLQGGSAHFGVHPWYWYLTEGLTSVLTIQLVPIVLGLVSPLRPTLLPLMAATFYVAFHSFLPHKEQRFLLPIIPLLCFYSGPFFVTKRWYLRRTLLYVMLLANTAIALYCGLRHQVGPYNAADSVLSMAAKRSGNVSVAALMPCYSIPGHSYFHNSVGKIRTLDCSPNLEGTSGTDEANQFHSDPLMWLDKHWNEKYSCNGTIVEHPEYGEVMQLSGDQRQQIKDFLVNVGIVKEENCKVHGF